MQTAHRQVWKKVKEKGLDWHREVVVKRVFLCPTEKNFL